MSPGPSRRQKATCSSRSRSPLTDGTDLKAFRRGHPLLLGPPPSPFGHEFCGVDVATGRRVVAANSAPCGACDACRRGQETLCENLFPLLNGAYAEFVLVPERIARTNLLAGTRGDARRGRGDGGATRVLPARRRRSGRLVRRHGRRDRARADRADALRVRRRRRRPAGGRRLEAGAARARPALRRRGRARRGRGRRDRGGRLGRGVGARARARAARRHRARVRRPAARGTRRGRPVSHPLRGGDAARSLPPHAEARASGARVPRERCLPVRAPRHPPGRARGRGRAARRPAARLPQGGRRRRG